MSHHDGMLIEALVVFLFSLAAGAVSLASGGTVLFYRSVSRRDNPRAYWVGVVLLGFCAVASLMMLVNLALH